MPHGFCQVAAVEFLWREAGAGDFRAGDERGVARRSDVELKLALGEFCLIVRCGVPRFGGVREAFFYDVRRLPSAAADAFFFGPVFVPPFRRDGSVFFAFLKRPTPAYDVFIQYMGFRAEGFAVGGYDEGFVFDRERSAGFFRKAAEEGYVALSALRLMRVVDAGQDFRFAAVFRGYFRRY